MHSGILFKAALAGPPNRGLYGHHGAQLLFIIIWIGCISHVSTLNKDEPWPKRRPHHNAENPSTKLYRGTMWEDLLYGLIFVIMNVFMWCKYISIIFWLKPGRMLIWIPVECTQFAVRKRHRTFRDLVDSYGNSVHFSSVSIFQETK